MNKKEQALFAEMEQKLRIAGAMRFTSPVLPDVLPPDVNYRGNQPSLTTGFHFIAYSGIGGDRVDEGCSSSVSHAIGRSDKTTSQGAVSLYSTRLLALKAMRYKVEQEVAARLAKIDKLIEDELADAKPVELLAK